MFALLLLLLLITTLAFWNFYWKRRALPPGPTPLPFFGNTLALKSSLYEPFRQWTREYGPIFTVWMGDEPMVMVTEYEAMRELFVKDGDTFAGRHFLVDLSMEFSVSKGKRAGVVCTEGELWKATRRAGLQWMRNLGVGKASMERQYLTDIEAMIGRIREKVPSSGNVWGTEVELQPHIDRLIGSTINRLLFGFAFSDDQLSMFYRLKAGMDRQQQLMSTVTGNMLMSRPWLRHLPVFSSTFAFLDHNASQLFAYFNRSIQQRVDEREKLGRRDPPQDMVDHFLDQMELSKEDPDQADYFSLDALHMFCLDMFIAGQETTSTTLSFLVLYLLLDQRVQAKLHAELDGLEKTGTTDESTADMITLADRPKLPFLNAVINESQRLCNLLPINLTHRTMADVEIMGGKYLLRKGTTVVPQISALLFDERVFPNPMRFEPERFLDEQGQLKRCDELIPFSLGKRICMGESLARMELFLFTANFFRHFRILPVDPLNPPSSERLPSFTARTHPYNCRLVLRQKE